ncbi:hypothetical protein DFAR_4000026 [Desulfarculales bacterium]
MKKRSMVVEHPCPREMEITPRFGGFFRRANHLARSVFITAAKEQVQVISSEHVRIAATGLI